MKYLKTYEYLKTPHVSDLVIYKRRQYKNGEIIFDLKLGYIKEYTQEGWIIEDYFDQKRYYVVKKYIMRKATPEDIEKFEIEMNAKKYNL